MTPRPAPPARRHLRTVAVALLVVVAAVLWPTASWGTDAVGAPRAAGSALVTAVAKPPADTVAGQAAPTDHAGCLRPDRAEHTPGRTAPQTSRGHRPPLLAVLPGVPRVAAPEAAVRRGHPRADAVGRASRRWPSRGPPVRVS